jgi:hypothetical protein
LTITARGWFKGCVGLDCSNTVTRRVTPIRSTEGNQVCFPFCAGKDLATVFAGCLVIQ